MAVKCTVAFFICIMFNICNGWTWPDDEILNSNHYQVDDNGWLIENVRPKRQNSPSSQSKAPSAFRPLAKKYDSFDWTLFQAISSSKDTNTISSPFSVKLLLTITREAAWGVTRNEIESVLDLPQELHGLGWFDSVISSLEQKSSLYDLNVATKVFLDKRVTPDKSFMDTVQQYFHTSTQSLNFKDTKHAAKEINDWCFINTNRQIKDLVKPDQLQDAVAMLTNAIYFKGVWDRKFDKDSTAEMTFTNLKGNRVTVPMMRKKDPAYYLETSKLDGGARLLRLPYKGDKFAITFILPYERNGLDKVIASIKPGLIRELQHEMKNETVEIFLPKFDFKSQSSFKESLQALNINNVFTDAARLPGFGPEQIALEDVIQKAGIKIDEEGTEVAVATAAIFGLSSMGSGKPIFLADHPFAFFIEEEKSGILLFAGKVVDPLENQQD